MSYKDYSNWCLERLHLSPTRILPLLFPTRRNKIQSMQSVSLSAFLILRNQYVLTPIELFTVKFYSLCFPSNDHTGSTDAFGGDLSVLTWVRRTHCQVRRHFSLLTKFLIEHLEFASVVQLDYSLLRSLPHRILLLSSEPSFSEAKKTMSVWHDRVGFCELSSAGKRPHAGIDKHLRTHERVNLHFCLLPLFADQSLEDFLPLIYGWIVSEKRIIQQHTGIQNSPGYASFDWNHWNSLGSDFQWWQKLPLRKPGMGGELSLGKVRISNRIPLPSLLRSHSCSNGYDSSFFVTFTCQLLFWRL